MERYEIPKPGRQVAMALLALLVLGGCGGDDPTEPIPAGPEPLVFNNFQEASFVLGQLDMLGENANLGGGVGSIGIASTVGSATGLPLFVADRGNHRVLGFNDFPVEDGPPADFALGQVDLTSNGSGTTANTFDTPSEAVVSGGKLFLADSDNRRILIWNSVPSSNTPADVVVGQFEFTSVPPINLPEPTSRLFVPGFIAVSAGKLFVNDNFNNRILIWNTIPTQNGAEADVVVGQTDFTSNGPGISATSLDSPSGLWAGNSKLIIADSGNRRVLIFNTIPITNGIAADVVVGAHDFDSSIGGGPDSNNFGIPTGVTSDGLNLYVADFEYNRVLIFPFPTANGAAATGVLGQSTFFHTSANDSDQDGGSGPDASGRTLSDPFSLAIIEKKLIVTDTGNNRLLVFDSK